jgi:UDP-N-acetylglucosamine transferase subunit ALG13
MSTFITVGNAHQPFTRLLHSLVPIFPTLPRPIIVQHGHTPFASSIAVAVPFLSMDEFSHRISEAALLIMHAGAGSIITALVAGKRPVVVPRLARFGEHVDDHQNEFALEMARLGRVVLVEDPETIGGIPITQLSIVAERKTASPLVGLVGRALLGD